jgi:hypothetical protein
MAFGPSLPTIVSQFALKQPRVDPLVGTELEVGELVLNISNLSSYHFRLGITLNIDSTNGMAHGC